MTSLKHDNFYWAGGIILLALLMRFFWLYLLQNQIGFDPVRYLWISEHVMRGDYKLLPQLWTTPLMPGTIGLMAQVTGNPLWTGRIIGILGNTLAVAVAILLIRRLFPLQPWFAWLTGVGLAVNHIWCRTAVFMVTENFFYPLAAPASPHLSPAVASSFLDPKSGFRRCPGPYSTWPGISACIVVW